MGANRLLGLDALRGIAALLVVWHHVLWHLARNGSQVAASISEQFDFGKFGVSLFFLISGYVIPGGFRHGLQGFVIGRAARLFPALWLSIIVYMATIRQVFPVEVLVANMLMIAEPVGLPLISLPYWTLQWELGFYIICAGLFTAGELENPKVVFALCLAAVVGSLWWNDLIFLGFMLGGSLARMSRGRDLGALLTLAVGLTLIWAPAALFGALWLAPPIFLLCLRWQAPKPLVGLGAISYSLYLFHPPVAYLAAMIIFDPLPLLVVVSAVSMGLSAIVYFCVEKPMIEFGRAAIPKRANQVTA